jgi:uncharacterized protein (TIGR02246 family)
MCPQFSGSSYAGSEEAPIEQLYRDMIEAWNQRDSKKMAAAFDADAFIIGFDGTQHRGAKDFEDSVGQIFLHHVTPPYLSKIKSVRFLTADVAQLEAIVGMIPPQKTELDPKLHALQVMTAVRRSRQWVIVHFQSTPAQFHGRPELAAAMTQEILDHAKRW